MFRFLTDRSRGKSMAHAVVRRVRLIPSVELLEQRTLLSTSFPLDPVNWTALGPAPVGGNNGSTGRISALAADPSDANTIYVATAGGGVWKTGDGGVHWTPLTDTQDTMYMGAIALAPSDLLTIYAGTGEANYGPSKIDLRRENIFAGRGVLKSTDGGKSWTLSGTDVFYRRTISKIVVDPKDANTVYAAVGNLAYDGLPGNTGIWKSTDGGKSWDLVVNGITSFTDNDAVSDLVMDPNDAQHLYAAVGNPNGSPANGVYETLDGGANWSVSGNFPTGVIDPQIGRITLAISRSSRTTLFASIAQRGANAFFKAMYRTTDGGATWTRLPGVPGYMGPYGDYNTTLAIDPSDPNVVYAGGQTSIIRTTNGGGSWSFIDVGVHADHHGAGFDASGRFLDGNDGGIWRLDNPATLRWANLNGDLNTIQLTGIALDPTDADIAYGGAQDNNSEKFTDSLQWRGLLGGDGGFTRVDFARHLTVYLTFQYTASSGFLFRSENGGTGLHSVTSGINHNDPANFYAPYVMDPSNSNRLLLGTNRVYEALNQGNNWMPISTPLTGGWTVRDVVDSVAAAGSDPNTVYATAGAHVFVTRDHGQNWTESNPAIPQPGLRFRDIRVDPNDPLTAWVVAASFSDVTGGGHVWTTSDGGVSWSDITSNLPDEPVWTVAIQPSGGLNILYVGAEDGVYGSFDGGASWARTGEGFPRVQVHQLEVNTAVGILAAATYGRGMWELALDSQTQAPRAAAKSAAALLNAGLISSAATLRQAPRVSFSSALPDDHAGGLPPSLAEVDRLFATSDQQGMPVASDPESETLRVVLADGSDSPNAPLSAEFFTLAQI